MKFIFPSLLALFSLLTFDSQSLAQPGQLDSSFGVAGIGRADFRRKSYDQGFSSVLQPDGKIVVAASCRSNHPQLTEEPFNLAVSRFNPDGSRDMSFGSGGIATKTLREGITSVTVVALQSDGKIVAGSTSFVGSPSGFLRSFRVIRFNADGQVDTTFGSGGIVTTSFPVNVHGLITSIVIQPDGKILAVGYSIVGSTQQSMIAVRYNIDGSIDQTFNGGSPVFVEVTSAGSRATSVDLQPDGKIVLGGNVRTIPFSSPTDFAVVRLNSNGTLDNSFDGDGKVVTPITGGSSSVNGVKVQADGKIVAVGNAATNTNIALVRYNSDGGLDSSFDSDGIVVTDIGTETANGLRIQPDGKVVVGGRVFVPNDPPFQFLSVRYTTSGALDTSYNGTGYVATRLGDATADNATSTLLQPDGKIILTGYTDNFLNADLALARYNPEGSLDSTFDGDGRVVAELGNTSERATKIALQPDGKIVAVGDAYSDGFLDMAISRFNADGTIDTTFGTQGFVAFHFPEANSWASDVEVQPDGKIVVAVNSFENARYLIFRFLSNGAVDGNFGVGGVATVQVGGNSDVVYDLLIQPDGKIVAAGGSFDTTSDNSLIRLNSDGSLDATFGSMGKVRIPDAEFSQVIRSIAIDSAGKIYAAATNQSGSSTGNTQFTVMRLNPNGTLDASFGGGIVHTPFSSQGFANAIALQDDGKVVVTGMGWEAYPIARYNTNGTLDTTFDGDGKVVTPVTASAFCELRGLAIQQNGKIVVTGSVPDGTEYDASVFRYSTDGSLDTTFGVGGKVISSSSELADWYYSVVIRPNGRIVAGGASSNGRNYDFTLGQYIGDAVSGGAPFDFDGDGKTDVGIFRPNGPASEWWINRSSDGQTLALQFGASTDRIVPADYTGDGKADIAFFRPASGEWYVLRSEDFSFFALPFGANGDVPVPADYDADGKSDFAVFRPSTATWFISQSSGAPTQIVQFGLTADVPVVADYDGDGRADIAIFRNNSGVGEWWINRSTAGVLAMQFGAGTDKAVPGDYTGDGKADIGIWRPADGNWLIVRSEDFSFFGFPFGTTGDVVAPGDFDGDGKFDPTVFRPSSATWFIARTTAGTQIVQFGANGDRPIPNAFVP